MYSYFKNVEVFKERPMLITRKEIKIKSSCIQFLIFTEGKSETLDKISSNPYRDSHDGCLDGEGGVPTVKVVDPAAQRGTQQGSYTDVWK